MKSLLVVFVFLMIVLPVFATSQFGQAGKVDVGVAVSRDFVDEHGNIVRVTVTPPRDRAVDLRIFEGWGFVHPGGKGEVDAAEAPKKKVIVDERPMDVSDYEVFIEPIRVAASCLAEFRGLRLTPVSLGAGRTYTVKASYPEHMVASVFPTQGDVDLFVRDGTHLCQSSINGAGIMDAAGCYFGTCVNSGKVMKSQFKNVSLINAARFVAMVSIIFITL